MAFSAIRRAAQDILYHEKHATNPEYSFDIPGRSPASVDGFRLRFVTQNVWGLPAVSLHLEERIPALCRYIGEGDFDVVALQEVWHAQERDYIRRECAKFGLVFTHAFSRGVGMPVWPMSGTTGLMVLSRYPIVDAFYFRFSVNGKPYKLHHADYMGAKGCGLVRIATPAGTVDVFNTHLHSCYVAAQQRPDFDEYKATRVAQSFELARFVNLLSRSRLCILMGDLNSPPESIALDLVRNEGGLVDAFAELNPHLAATPASPPPSAAISESSATDFLQGTQALARRRRASGTGTGKGAGKGALAVESEAGSDGAGGASAPSPRARRPSRVGEVTDPVAHATCGYRVTPYTEASAQPIRMDYVLYHAASAGAGQAEAASPAMSPVAAALAAEGVGAAPDSSDAPARAWQLVDCRIIRDWATPTGKPVSDHLAVTATFELRAEAAEDGASEGGGGEHSARDGGQLARQAPAPDSAGVVPLRSDGGAAAAAATAAAAPHRHKAMSLRTEVRGVIGHALLGAVVQHNLVVMAEAMGVVERGYREAERRGRWHKLRAASSLLCLVVLLLVVATGLPVWLTDAVLAHAQTYVHQHLQDALGACAGAGVGGSSSGGGADTAAAAAAATATAAAAVAGGATRWTLRCVEHGGGSAAWLASQYQLASRAAVAAVETSGALLPHMVPLLCCLACVFLAVHTVIELLLAKFPVADEMAGFIEVMQQMRLHKAGVRASLR